MPTLRIPLVGSYTNRTPNAVLSSTNDQRFVNCFPEVITNPLTKKSSVWLNKRPGSVTGNDVQASATGSFGSVVAQAGGALVSYVKSGGASTMVFVANSLSQVGGDIASTSAISFLNTTNLSGTENITATMVDTGAYEAWFYPAGGAWTQITDSDFPAAITPSHAHMDGFMFVMATNGRLYNSDVNSVSSWSATSFITANTSGDAGTGCARYKNFIMAFGSATTEFYVNAGNATGSVLRRVDDMTVRIGAIAATPAGGSQIREVGDSVYWIGRNGDTGKRGIYRMNGGKVEKISNPTVDRVLLTAVNGYILGSFTHLGMTHVAFSLFTNTTALCYCVETGFWWQFTPASTLNLTAMVADANADSYFIVSDNAKVYATDATTPVWVDNSVAYTMTAQTEPVDAETDRMKFWEKLRLTYDRQSSTSEIGVSWSDDDYSNFGTVRNIDTSSAQSWISGLGASRRRAWRFTHSANTACRIKAAEMDYRVGSA